MNIVVTGAAGNLGRKAVAMLVDAPWCGAVTAIDIVPAPAAHKTAVVVADLCDPEDGRWIVPVATADAVLHLASRNPTSRQTWAEAVVSFDMTLNLLARAGDSGRLCRFVFASSNHAMGGYKDVELAPGELLRMDTPPLHGTRYLTPDGYRQGTPYGAGKLLGERACIARASASRGRMSAVCVRIGWCQEGDNDAATISALGLSGGIEPPADEARSLGWYRNMWLSNADFAQLIERAIRADTSSWPGSAIIVSGVSANSGTPWAVDEAERWIGYRPSDDLWERIATTDHGRT